MFVTPVGLAPTTIYFSARMLIEPTRTTPVQLTQGKESVRDRTVGFVQTRARYGRVRLVLPRKWSGNARGCGLLDERSVEVAALWSFADNTLCRLGGHLSTPT